MSRLEGDIYVNGNLNAKTLTVPAGTVTNAAVHASAAIAATKLDHQHRAGFAQANTAAVAETRVVHVVYGATGTVVDFRAGSIAPCTGNSTITLDLKKNGASILSAPVVLDSTNTARVAEAGTISGGSVVAGDVLEVVVTVSAGTGTLGTGLFAAVTVNEAAQ